MLWRELREQGFRGSESTVLHYLQKWRVHLPDEAKRKFVADKNGISRVPPSPRQTGWLLTRPDLCKKDWQAEYADKLCCSSNEIATAKMLVAKFYRLLKNGMVEELQNWLVAAKATGIAEIVQFANGIEGDRKVVEAAIETGCSNGQVEGQVNKPKTVKRMMFGRAKFDLLRAKVLCRN